MTPSEACGCPKTQAYVNHIHYSAMSCPTSLSEGLNRPAPPLSVRSTDALGFETSMRMLTHYLCPSA